MENSLYERARTGDLEAIACLLERAVSPHELRITVARQAEKLSLKLRGTTLPQKRVLLILLDRELLRLRLPFLTTVVVLATSLTEIETQWQEEFTLGTYANAVASPSRPKLRTAREGGWFYIWFARFAVKEVSLEAWKAIAAGIFIAILVVSSQQANFLFSPLIIIIHEGGHAAMGWLFGYPTIPAFDFIFGGGVAIHFGRSSAVLMLIYGGLLWWIYRSRRNVFASRMLLGFLILYTSLVATRHHEAIIVAMGHGFELIFALIFLYRAIDGFGCRYSIERPLSAAIAFTIIFNDLRFAWNLLHDPVTRAIYFQGKGGILDHDFTRLARDFFHVEFDTVVTSFLVLTLLTPLLTFLCYRYSQVWIHAILRLFRTTQELRLEDNE